MVWEGDERYLRFCAVSEAVGPNRMA